MMKAKKVEVEIVEGEGLVALLGKRVLLMCANYFYEGILEGVNGECVALGDPGIVYETGPWSSDKWRDRQALGISTHYIMKNAIESFGAFEKSPKGQS